MDNHMHFIMKYRLRDTILTSSITVSVRNPDNFLECTKIADLKEILLGFYCCQL